MGGNHLTVTLKQIRFLRNGVRLALEESQRGALYGTKSYGRLTEALQKAGVCLMPCLHFLRQTS